MSEELETSILKVNSIEEAQRLAEATGKIVEWEQPSQYKPFEPRLSFIQSLKLRFWLLRKRTYWFIQKIIGRLKR